MMLSGLPFLPASLFHPEPGFEFVVQEYVENFGGFSTLFMYAANQVESCFWRSHFAFK